ncbi:MAG TPA: tryptophan halogenase family protein [Actinophytocola sp.]|uniref:tryptophan halogenase family protein n=1 Tax=Actinophytocola sp. TaxID=1872138 RepID=UPI002DBAB7CE|nr:tryptophan halogenase family protein [Actinophytocola sp.]HEU5473643.1 tryptophan halogenase family protein [Actinophytocola sp.]
MVRKVVVVGGGTAGWMTASYLQATFGERIEITVIESDRVPTIGVGEATFSTIRHFFEYLGLAESDWMPACGATYKLAIRFENWRRPGHYFYHPFERLRSVDGFPISEWWLAHGEGDRADRDIFLMAALGDALLAPRYLDGRLFDDGPTASDQQVTGRTTLSEQTAQFPYAYHFDAALLAAFLRDRAVRLGVQHVLDDVQNVNLSARGSIDHLVTKNHGELRGDLYIDCSGFRGLLINQALGEPFESYQDYLPNDRAVALRVPADQQRDGIPPYTRATAMDAGWIWTIPLFHRNGMGYVYSADYCSPEDAERTLREYAGPAAADLEANHIKMRVGRSRRFWVQNCVAIGLSGGFVEPLESTGIFFIQYGIEQLVKHFPAFGHAEDLAASYNTLLARCLDGVREFLFLHYYTAAREDNRYWKDARQRTVPPGLAERLEAWRVRLPDTENVWSHYHGFEPYSYTAMLLGLGGLQTAPRPALQLVDPARAEREFADIAARSAELVRTLPSHYEYVASLHEAATG